MSKKYYNNVVQNGRDGRAMIVAGFKGHGKSSYVRQRIDASPLPHALVYKFGLNLFDPAFKGYPIINDLRQYKGGKVIVNGGKVKYADFIKFCFRIKDINVVIDDAKTFERHSITQEMADLLIYNRRIPADVWLIYHGMTDVPIEMYSCVNDIILFHTVDSIERKGNKIPSDIMPMLLTAKNRISQKVAKGHKYYKEVITLA